MLEALFKSNAPRIRLWPGAPLPGEPGFSAALRTTSGGDSNGGLALASAAAAAGGLDPAWYGSPDAECGGLTIDGSEAALHAAWPLGALAPWGVPQAVAPLGPLETPAAAAAAREVVAGSHDGSRAPPIEIVALQLLVAAAAEAEGLSAEVESLEAGVRAAAFRLPPPAAGDLEAQLNAGSDERRVLLSYGVSAEAVPRSVGRRAVFATALEAETASASAALLAHARGAAHAAVGGNGEEETEAVLSDLLAVPRPSADAQLRVVAVEGDGDAAAAEWRQSKQGQLQESAKVELAAALLSSVLDAGTAEPEAAERATARAAFASSLQWPERVVDELAAAAQGDEYGAYTGCAVDWSSAFACDHLSTVLLSGVNANNAATHITHVPQDAAAGCPRGAVAQHARGALQHVWLARQELCGRS